MVAIKKTHSIETALGELNIALLVEGPTATRDGASIAVSSPSAELPANLPAGMRVEANHAVLLNVDSGASPVSVKFSAEMKSDANGSPCTGQFLAAIEWDRSDRLVVVGTEDPEALIARMPWLELEPNVGIETYSMTKIEIHIGKIVRSKPVSFHMAIAENPLPEPHADSAWFAVDIAHKQLLKNFCN